ncbi:MAG: hypothetical protein IBX44_09055 [Sulfurospirillum sp.]|nr:hypothetical protein [Sulfurospirillum sp.]
MHFIAYLVLVLFFTACSQSVYVPLADTPLQQKTQQKTHNLPIFEKSGIIKGIIKVQKKDTKTGLWLHEVHANDTANGKLSFARFYDAKRVASVGEKIYAIIKEEKLQEFYLLARAKIITKEPKKQEKPKIAQEKKTQKPQKRTKAKKNPQFAVPQSEMITLD